MRRWDRLQDSYMEEYRARGVSAVTISYTESRLDRWGRWLKKRRPRVAIERIDADTITRYMEACTSFRSKSTVYGMLSTMRGFGDYLVRQGLWKISPLRWMKGPKITPYSRLPKRIDQAYMEALWRAAAHLGRRERQQPEIALFDLPQALRRQRRRFTPADLELHLAHAARVPVMRIGRIDSPRQAVLRLVVAVVGDGEPDSVKRLLEGLHHFEDDVLVIVLLDPREIQIG